MSNKLYDLSIVRKKLVIKQLREITPKDLIPVRETLNSIDFIMGDDDVWEYVTDGTGCTASTKLRLYNSEEIINFLKDNNDSTKLSLHSVDHAFITDITQVYKITRVGKTKKEIQELDLDEIIAGNKRRICKLITEAIENINSLAEAMGAIL